MRLGEEKTKTKIFPVKTPMGDTHHNSHAQARYLKKAARKNERCVLVQTIHRGQMHKKIQR